MSYLSHPTGHTPLNLGDFTPNPGWLYHGNPWMTLFLYWFLCHHGRLIRFQSWPWPCIFKKVLNLVNLRRKWSDCHEIRNKHTDWTLNVKCDHQFCLCPWNKKPTYRFNARLPIWPSILSMSMKQQTNISLECQASNMTINFVYVHETRNQHYRLNARLPIWPSILSMSMKQETNTIAWMLGFQYDHQFGSWP